MAQIDADLVKAADIRYDIKLRNVNLKIEFLSIMTQIYL